MKKYVLLALISVLTGTIISFFSNREVAIESIEFRTGLFDRGLEGRLIKEAIEDYNKYSASFYNTGGYLEGLGDIPAAPLLKRRLFKDINMLKGDGLVMVFDRDRSEIKKISFISKDTVVAASEEIWLVSLQDIATRSPVLSIKASSIKARYLLRKEHFPLPTDRKRWVVVDVDVYPADEKIPGIVRSPVI